MLLSIKIVIIDFLLNLRAGVKTAFFQRFYVWDFKISFSQVIILFLLSVLLPSLFDYLDALPKPIFNPYGLNYQASLFVFFLFSLTLLVVIEKKTYLLQQALVQFLSLVPVMSIIYIASVKLAEKFVNDYLHETLWGLLGAYLIWYVAVSYCLIAKLFHRSKILSIAYMVLYIGINFLALFYLPSVSIWYPSLENQQEEQLRINVEDTYYRQTYLLDASLDQVKTHTLDKVDMYFLGFAGYAHEDVFVHEVQAAKKLMDERFNTKHRSMILANNQDYVRTYPLANTHNLWESLESYADKMDLDEDILFIFLSSHGGKDHTLSTRFGNMNMNALSVKSLKNGLDGAGFKWRVIIVSACYSGGFIEPLQDENSLIITAAAKDRNSFGCGHDGEFTYFGEAFFGDHLKTQWSFIEAFNNAKADIKQREADQDYKASLPQIYVGEEIEEKLDMYVENLKNTSPLDWARIKH